jgi:hypothetical protein
MQKHFAIADDLPMPYVSHTIGERFARLAAPSVAVLALPTSGMDSFSPVMTVSLFRFDAIFDCVLSEKTCNNVAGRFL